MAEEAHTVEAAEMRGIPPMLAYTNRSAGAGSALQDPARRQELSRAAGGVAQNPAYSWDAITRQFDDLIVRLATAPYTGR
jgi:hypothetical protein